MKVFSHPVLQEATEIYLLERKGWAAYLYFLVLLASV
jgi:hypothetical protein